MSKRNTKKEVEKSSVEVIDHTDGDHCANCGNPIHDKWFDELLDNSFLLEELVTRMFHGDYAYATEVLGFTAGRLAEEEGVGIKNALRAVNFGADVALSHDEKYHTHTEEVNEQVALEEDDGSGVNN